MHPVLFKTAHFTVYSYGVCAALAAALAFFLTGVLARRKGLPVTRAADILFLALIAGLFGARLFYVLQHPADYAGCWPSAFLLQEGGLVWYGGFLGAALAVFAAARRLRSPFLVWADFFSPVLPLAHAVGRVGCFLNGCCYGKSGHPVQLYEAAFLLLLSLFLFSRFLKTGKQGEVFGLYLAGYGVVRFMLEFLRGDQQTWMGLTIPQVFSLLSVAAGLWLFRRACRPR